MKLNKIIILAVSLMATSSAYAQYTGDALRFSQFENGVDARMGAMGGQKSSIGGDISSIYGNPAGLGMFTRSEFSLTPDFSFKSNKVTTLNGMQSQSKNNVGFGNIGAVFHNRTYKTGDPKKGMISLNFGIGYQRRNSFNNDFMFGATTSGNGLGQLFTERSNKDFDGQYPAEPSRLLSNVDNAANRFNLTDYNDSFSDPYADSTAANASQQYAVARKGSSGNVDFSLGLNISNKLFLGFGLGLANFNYTSAERVNEAGRLIASSNNDYNVNYTKYFDTEGSGINLKVGAIFKPTNEFRLGLSFESPTWYSVTDNYSESINSSKTSFIGDDSYPFEYNLRTPLKINGGLAYFIGSRGFISADVGFVDYSTIKLSSSDNVIDMNTKRDITDLYQGAVNYSVGGEFKVSESFLLRAGFSSTGNPYKNLNDKDYTVNSISGGLGYRFGDYYLDAALVNSNRDLNYRNYTLDSKAEPYADVQTRTNKIALTFGVRF